MKIPRIILFSASLAMISVLANAAFSAKSSTRFAAQSARNAPKSIRDVRRVYVRKIAGDRVFSQRLLREMRGLGIQIVASRANADAIFDAQGDYSKGAFYGSMKFTDSRNRVLWSTRVTRPRGSNYMAYSRLIDKLRAALQ